VKTLHHLHIPFGTMMVVSTLLMAVFLPGLGVVPGNRVVTVQPGRNIRLHR